MKGRFARVYENFHWKFSGSNPIGGSKLTNYEACPATHKGTLSEPPHEECAI